MSTARPAVRRPGPWDPAAGPSTQEYAMEPFTLDTGATAWILTSAALVLLMTPGLSLFYGAWCAPAPC